jgi:phage terminase large subunit-like protein
MPSREAAYRNLILNQRINLTNPFVSRTVWAECGGDVDMGALEQGRVYLGLDLSKQDDLTAAVAVAQDDDGVWHVKSAFFAPADGVLERSRRDRAPYDQWAQEGYIQLTPGGSVDYGFVAVWLAEFAAEHDVACIWFDRWRIDVLERELDKIGAALPMKPFGQGYKDMTPALDATERALVNGKLRHGMNPVLTMCAANAVVTKDPAENRKLDKSKATGRIDGMVALAMAIGGAAAMQEEPVPSYELLSVGGRR